MTLPETQPLGAVVRTTWFSLDSQNLSSRTTVGVLEPASDRVIRMMCHWLLEQLPAAALVEVCESIQDAREFYSESLVPLPSPLPRVSVRLQEPLRSAPLSPLSDD